MTLQCSLVRRWRHIDWRPAVYDSGDLISLRIHALLIGDVVTSLELIRRVTSLITCHRGSAKKAGSGTDCRTSAGIARGRANQRTDSGTYHRSDHSAGVTF